MPRFYTFALSIESDARMLARRLGAGDRAGGGRGGATPASGVVVISTDTPLLKRFATAFAAEWTMAGGSAPGAYRFDANPVAMTSMRREIMRKPPGAVLLALDGTSAALMKPYLGTLPAYASALVFERETLAVARDLDGLVLVEIPWIVDPGAPQFAAFPKREFASAALTRLYALGLDAFRVAQAFTAGAPENFTLEGATGQVTLVDGHQFAREGRLARVPHRAADAARCRALNARRARTPARAPRRSPPSFSSARASRSRPATSARASGKSTLSRASATRSCSSRSAFARPPRSAAPRRASRRPSARGCARRRDAYLATLARVPACRFDAILLDALTPARITWVRDILDD